MEHLWICADDEDRPKQLYTRLGFRPVLIATTLGLAVSMLACAFLSAGTPLASGATSGQRIKLNFAAGGQGKDVYTNGGDSGAGSDDD